MAVDRVLPDKNPGTDGRGKNYKWIALSNTTLGILMAAIDGSIVIIALPAIFNGIQLNPLEPGSTCVPDSAHGIECEPRVWLRIPVKLGPRTQQWDVSFSGASALAPKALAEAADVKLGEYVSTLKLEEARRRVVDAYKEEGYAFADVKYSLDQSPDHTRARGAVAAEIPLVVLFRNRVAVVVQRDRDRAGEPAHARMVTVDSAVEYAHLRAPAGRAGERPLAVDQLGQQVLEDDPVDRGAWQRPGGEVFVEHAA